MRLISLTDAKDNGSWFTFSKDGAGNPAIEFKVRRVPGAKEREIEFRILGYKAALRHRRGEALQELDMRKLGDVNVEKAVYALVDSRGCEIDVQTDVDAQLFGKELGTPVKVGEEISLDTRWTDPLRERVLSEMDALVTWVGRKTKQLEATETEDEEGKG